MSQQHDNSVTICNLVVETIGDISYAPQLSQINIIQKYFSFFKLCLQLCKAFTRKLQPCKSSQGKDNTDVKEHIGITLLVNIIKKKLSNKRFSMKP